MAIFRGKTLHDTVYVSGNQWYLKLRDELNCELHKYYDVERDAVGARVPSPRTLRRTARECADRHPNKRQLIHFMQPHRPYLGKNKELFTDDSGDGRIELREVIPTIRSGRATWDDLRAAYRDNLRLVLEEAQLLVESLEGKTVISADHGELLGDRIRPVPIRWYGHPSSVYVDTLTRVPWHVVSEGPRREIVAEPPEQELEIEDSGEVVANLRNLGYL